MTPRDFESATAGEIRLSVSGMTCSACANTVTRVLSRVPGVATATVDFASGRTTVAGTAKVADLIAAVTAAGYGAVVSSGSDQAEKGHEHGGCGCC